MSRQFWAETLSWMVSTPTAIANTVTESVLVPNVTIPANYLADGRCLRLAGWGSYGTTSTPTIQFAVRWGGLSGTVISKSAAVTLTSAVGGGASMTAMFSWEIYLQVRTNGSSGTLMTNGMFILHTSTAATAGTVTNYGLPIPLASGSTGGTTPVAVTVDLTQDTALTLSATWGTSNAANSIQALNSTIEAMN